MHIFWIVSNLSIANFVLLHEVVNYLAQLYCICVLWNNLDSIQIADIHFDWDPMAERYPQMIWLKYDALSENETDFLVRMGVDHSCQVI